MPRTKEQIAAYKAAHYAAQKAADPVGFMAKRLKRSREWHAAHPEKGREACRKYRAKNLEKCHAQQAEYREKNRERLNARARAYAVANREQIKARRDALEAAKPGTCAERARNLKARKPEHTLLKAAQRNAQVCQVPFNLEVTDIFIPAHCPVFGMELKRGEGKWSEGSPSIDRIVPDLGYVKGNILIVSWKANRFKNNATIIELQQLAAYYSRYTTP